MAVIEVRGAQPGIYFLNEMHIESMRHVETPRQGHCAWITTVSGQEFYRTFGSRDQAMGFMSTWAGRIANGIQQEHPDSKD